MSYKNKGFVKSILRSLSPLCLLSHLHEHDCPIEIVYYNNSL